MASLEQKKAMMAAVPIHSDARTILGLPGDVETYAQLDEWKAKHGDSVSKYIGEAFKAIFNLHCSEHEAMLKSSRVYGQLGNYAVTSPTHSRADRAPGKNQTAPQDTAFRENRPPIQHQLVNAFGESVSNDSPAPDESSFNRTSSNKSFGKSQAHATSHEPRQHYWGPDPDSFKSKSRKASTGPSSAAAESFARQMKLNGVNTGQIPQTQCHDHTHVHDGLSEHDEHVRDGRTRRGSELGARGGTDQDSHRTMESFARQIMLHNVAKDENHPKELAAQAEKKVSGITVDKTMHLQTLEGQEYEGVEW